jgi:formate dehydrogenase major subunit
MAISRRGFLKLTGATLATSVMYQFAGQSTALAVETAPGWKLVDVKETPTICCYCSGGCGTIVSVRDGELINIEGDPDHPVNRGGLCSKGSSQFGVNSVYDDKTGERIINPNRIQKPMVRRAGATDWEELSWEQAIDEISDHIKKTRDENYETKDDKGVTVNRCEAIANFGAAALDNEEGYALQKMCRALGLTYIEHQARI